MHFYEYAVKAKRQESGEGRVKEKTNMKKNSFNYLEWQKKTTLFTIYNMYTNKKLKKRFSKDIYSYVLYCIVLNYQELCYT